MEDNNWYDVFMENLLDKFPKKSQLTQEIMNLLNLEREATYRRLRKEVIFTFQEIATMASAWNISLDEVAGINSGNVTFQMRPINFLNPSPKELNGFRKRMKMLEHLKTSENSEFMEVSNRLPRPISSSFLLLYRFEIFRWAYLYNNDGALKQFNKVVIPHNLVQEFINYNKNIKCVTKTHFMLDPMVFDHLINNIQYFHSILLISDEEKEELKEELFSLLEYMMKMAVDGCYPETQNKVNLYISQLNIDTNYSYFYTDKLKVCRIHAFGKYDICSFELDMVNKFKTWMHLKKRASIQISEVNERSRVEYFAKQREIVEKL